MAIMLPEGLPAQSMLLDEGLDVIAAEPGQQATDQALRVALINLMPDKPTSETQIARLLGSSPHLVDLTLVAPASYRPKTTPAAHMRTFYQTWPAIRAQRFDGLIVTGAPVETLPFEAVIYWQELTEIFDWAAQSVGGSLFICWAAQAALQHRYRVAKQALPEKIFGVYHQTVRQRNEPLLRGFSTAFPVPVSRHTEVRSEDLPPDGSVEVLAESPESGLCLLRSAEQRALYMFNHLEYDADTLGREYQRDRDAGRPIQPPCNAFPDDDPSKPPHNGWRPYAHLLFRNWLDGLAAAAARQRGSRRDLSWSLRPPLGAIADSGSVAEFRILTQDHLDALPAVLCALAGQGLSPLAVRLTKDEAGALRIDLRLDGMDSSRSERSARLLLGLAAVHRVSYRDAGGSGGSFVCTAKTGDSVTTQADDDAVSHRSTAA